MKKLINLLLIAFYLVILILLYWYFYPYKIIEFRDSVFPITNKVVYQGEIISYISRYCKFMNLSSTTVRNYVDTLIYTMPATTTNRDTGCHEYIFSTLIPNKLPVGSYYIEMLYKYEVNPIRTIVIKQNTERFEVLEATVSARR